MKRIITVFCPAICVGLLLMLFSSCQNHALSDYNTLTASEKRIIDTIMDSKETLFAQQDYITFIENSGGIYLVIGKSKQHTAEFDTVRRMEYYLVTETAVMEYTMHPLDAVPSKAPTTGGFSQYAWDEECSEDEQKNLIAQAFLEMKYFEFQEDYASSK